MQDSLSNQSVMLDFIFRAQILNWQCGLSWINPSLRVPPHLADTLSSRRPVCCQSGTKTCHPQAGMKTVWLHWWFVEQSAPVRLQFTSSSPRCWDAVRFTVTKPCSECEGFHEKELFYRRCELNLCYRAKWGRISHCWSQHKAIKAVIYSTLRTY